MTTANTLRNVLSLICSIGAVAGYTTTAARADEPKPDKSGYTLFNPTPDSALRDFAADRPAKSYGPTTIDAGRVQLEMELSNYSYQSTDGIRTRTYVGPNPTARVGLTNSVELQLNMAPYVHQHVRDTVADTSTSASGVSDLFARAKINLWGNEGGRTAFAIMPYVKFGTAPESLGGNRTTEYGVIAPLSITLPENRSLVINTEVDFLKNSLDSNFHNQYVNTISLSGPIAKDWTLTGELWSQINVDPARTIRQYSFDTALAWVPRPNFQWDIGANVGLNKDTPALQVYTGITRRF